MNTTRRGFLGASAALAAGAAAPGCTGAARPAAGAGASPAPDRPAILHDLHTHTVYSDGYHPVPLHVLEARAFELDAIAITDHYTPASRIGTSEEEFTRYLDEIERERSAQDDLLILKGAEAAALDPTGRITLDARHAEKLEWVLCDLSGITEGVFQHTPADPARYRENVVCTYLALCDIPYLHVIAHPFNTGNTTPAALPADYPEPMLRELAAKMAEKKKVFDVMNDTIYWFQKSGIAPRALTAQYVELVRLFAAAGVMFQVSSDDHRTGLGNTRWSQIVLARAGVPPHQVVDPRRIRRVDNR
jgi:histidinol phosphatase-like PHP family hydrolase